MSEPMVAALAALKDLCSPFGAQVDGAASLYENALPPRFAWVLKRIPIAPPKGTGQGPTVEIGRDTWQWEVHCWAADLTAAMGLRRVAASALRKVFGQTLQLGSTTPIGGEELGTFGQVLVLEWAATLPLFAANLAVLPVTDVTVPTAIPPSTAITGLPATPENGALKPV